MLNIPMDVLNQFPVRKSKKQRQAFRDAVCTYVESLGYRVSVEKGTFGCRNVVIGDPDKARYLVTAHYDTPAVMLLPNLITPTNPVTFALYQLLQVILLLVIPFLISSLLGLGVLLAGLYFAPSWNEFDVVVMIMMIWYFGFVVLCLFGMGMLFWGPANKNNANDNTSGIVTLLEIARTLQKDQRHKVCFVLFDLEEKGLWGSGCYRSTHKTATDRQLVINLDCVGDGDNLIMFPSKKIQYDRKLTTSIYRMCGYWGKKSLTVHEKGFGYYPSDHKHFPYGIGIGAFRKNKIGPYLGKIHTRKDTTLDITNVNILRAAIISYISCNAVN